MDIESLKILDALHIQAEAKHHDSPVGISYSFQPHSRAESHPPDRSDAMVIDGVAADNPLETLKVCRRHQSKHDFDAWEEPCENGVGRIYSSNSLAFSWECLKPCPAYVGMDGALLNCLSRGASCGASIRKIPCKFNTVLNSTAGGGLVKFKVYTDPP